MNPKKITNRQEIKEWLHAHQILKYKINKDLSVDVDGGVNLKSKNLTSIPIQFNEISDYFDCSRNHLLSLDGAPRVVIGNFYCAFNALTSLQGGPHNTQHYDCSHNHLSNLEFCATEIRGDLVCAHNKLTSLYGAPKRVNQAFSCHHNLLKNLEFSPERVDQDYTCSHNNLENFEYCPLIVKWAFICRDNPLLGNLQNVSDFKKIKKQHSEYLSIKKEKNDLSEFLSPPTATKKTTLKI